jgi:hypothetical protein
LLVERGELGHQISASHLSSLGPQEEMPSVACMGREETLAILVDEGKKIGQGSECLCFHIIGSGNSAIVFMSRCEQDLTHHAICSGTEQNAPRRSRRDVAAGDFDVATDLCYVKGKVSPNSQFRPIVPQPVLTDGRFPG